MLKIELDHKALANTRFVISPLSTAVSALLLLRDGAPAVGGDWRNLVLGAVRRKRLRLLGSLFSGNWKYVPDFITPEPASAEPSVEGELHAVATTAGARVRFELDAMVSGDLARGQSGRGASPALREILLRGETAFAERAAVELATLWSAVIAPRWSHLRTRLEADIAYRSRVLARQGLAAVLAELHPQLYWHDGVLSAPRFQGDVSGSTGLILAPTVFDNGLLVVVDATSVPAHRQPQFTYPALPGRDAPPEDGAPEADGRNSILGATRAMLLADLQPGRTTSELGERHYLSAGTVSYHLRILHRAGLVTRTRSGKRVLYECTARGAGLLTIPAHAGPAG
jgi:DNA-binding transcriptional ArsR family regulator